MSNFFFTDEPMVRSEHPNTVNAGMNYYELWAGNCFLDSDFPGTNFNWKAFARWLLTGWSLWKFGFGFLTGGLRTNEKCKNIKLQFWIKGTIPDSMVIELHQMLVSWLAVEATWQEREAGVAWAAAGMLAGTDYVTAPIVTGSIGSFQNSPQITIDVSSWGKDVCDGVITNFGVALGGSNDDGLSVEFHGLNSDYFQQPALLVETVFEVASLVTDQIRMLESSPTLVSCNSSSFNIANSSSDVENRAIFGFDLSSIPSTLINPVVYFQFGLLSNFPSGFEWRFYRMLVDTICGQTSWNERITGTNWLVPGGQFGTEIDTDSLVTYISPGHLNNDIIQIDITELIVPIIRGTKPNKGFMITTNGVDTESVSGTGLGGTPDNERPRLVIEYQR